LRLQPRRSLLTFTVIDLLAQALQRGLDVCHGAASALRDAFC
jgi:hypothetical protein